MSIEQFLTLGFKFLPRSINCHDFSYLGNGSDSSRQELRIAGVTLFL